MKKRIIAFILIFALVIPILKEYTIQVEAGWLDMYSFNKVQAGETATITCYGTKGYQITNFMWDFDSPTIAMIKGYDSDNNLIYSKDIFGFSGSCSKMLCEGGERYIIEVLYGAVEVQYNTANTSWPTIVREDNNKKIEPLIRTTLQTEVYLAVGETAEYEISEVFPGYSAELVDDYWGSSAFLSEDTNVVTIDKEGKVTALREGETYIKLGYKFVDSDGNYFKTYDLCKVNVVDDTVDKKSGLKFYYSEEVIEPGDFVQIGADYSAGQNMGMYYPGEVRWEISNPDVVKINHTVDNVTVLYIDALNIGECDITLYLDGEAKRTETISVTISDDTMINDYMRYLKNCSVLSTLEGAKKTCWEIIEGYSNNDKNKISLATCFRDGLGFKVLTKELAASMGFTSSTYDDAVDSSTDAFLLNFFSMEEAESSEEFSLFKKKWKNVCAIYKSSAGKKDSIISALANNTNWSEKDISGVYEAFGKSSAVVDSGITLGELVITAVMSSQYERDAIVYLMNEISTIPGGVNSALYQGLGRKLDVVDDIRGYVCEKFINTYMLGKIGGIISKKIFSGNYYKVASSIAYLIAEKYRQEGGIFADDYMKACITLGFTGTLYNVLMGSGSAQSLKYNFEAYVSSVKAALESGKKIAICTTFVGNAYLANLGEIANDYVELIEQTCTYEKYIEQCRKELMNASKVRGTVTEENGQPVLKAYYVLPEKQDLQKCTFSAEYEGNSTEIADEKVIMIPAYIDEIEVTGIDKYGFSSLSGYQGMVLPNTVLSIESYAFSNCTDLEYLIMSDKVETIGEGAFDNCLSLKNVNLSEKLKDIEARAFSGCNNLEYISLGQNIKNVGEEAFKNCTSLKHVVVNSKDTVISENAFSNCSSNLIIYGYRNTSAEKIAKECGIKFIAFEETITNLEICKQAVYNEFDVGQVVSTEGLELKVFYCDGSNEIITGGWSSSCDTSSSGKKQVTVYYGDKKISYEVTIKDPEDKKMIISDKKHELFLSESFQLSASIQPDLRDNLDIIWESSDSEVIAVDNSGYVVAVGNGKAIITATSIDGKYTASCDFTVTDCIKYSNNSTGIQKKFILFTPSSNGWYVFYSTQSQREPAGYILNADGKVLPAVERNGGNDFRKEYKMQAGKTYVLETDVIQACGEFEVYIKKMVSAESITINNIKNSEIEYLAGYPGESKQLTVDFLPQYYSRYEEYSWKSDSPDIVSVDEEGKVYFKSLGKAVITVESENGLSDSCIVETKDVPMTSVDVNNPIKSSCDYPNAYFYFIPEVDGLYKIDVSEIGVALKIYDESGKCLVYKKALDNSIVAGEVFLEKERKYTIVTQCSEGNLAYNLRIIHMVPAEKVVITNNGKLSGWVGESTQLGVDFGSEAAISEICTWKSSDETVATVDTNGMVTFVGVGTAEITVETENGLTDRCEVVTREIPNIELNKQLQVKCEISAEVFWYKFTCDSDGKYVFYSSGDYDTIGILYDSSMKQLKINNEGGEKHNFRIDYNFEKGKTYYLKAKLYSDLDIGEFSLCLAKNESIENNIVMGDADGNGSITAEDALAILKHVVGSETLTEAALEGADVDANNQITAEDALAVLKKVVGAIDSFDEIKVIP